MDELFQDTLSQGNLLRGIDALLPRGFKDNVNYWPKSEYIVGTRIPTTRIEASDSRYLQKPLGNNDIPLLRFCCQLMSVQLWNFKDGGS